MVNGSRRVVKEFASSECRVARFGETRLKRFDLGMRCEVMCRSVATGCRSILTTEDCRPARRTKDAGRVGIGEVQPSRSESIDVGRLRPWRRFETTDPIVHVVDGEKQNIRFRLGVHLRQTKGENGKQTQSDSYHGRLQLRMGMMESDSDRALQKQQWRPAPQPLSFHTKGRHATAMENPLVLRGV